eukprot:g11500.t1
MHDAAILNAGRSIGTSASNSSQAVGANINSKQVRFNVDEPQLSSFDFAASYAGGGGGAAAAVEKNNGRGRSFATVGTAPGDAGGADRDPRDEALALGRGGVIEKKKRAMQMSKTNRNLDDSVNMMRARKEAAQLFVQQHKLPDSVKIAKLGQLNTICELLCLEDGFPQHFEIYPFPDCLELKFFFKQTPQQKHASFDFEWSLLRMGLAAAGAGVQIEEGRGRATATSSNATSAVMIPKPSVQISVKGHRLFFRFLIVDDNFLTTLVEKDVYVPPDTPPAYRKVQLLIYGEAPGSGGGAGPAGVDHSSVQADQMPVLQLGDSREELPKWMLKDVQFRHFEVEMDETENRDLRVGGRRSVLNMFASGFTNQRFRLFKTLHDFGKSWKNKVKAAILAKPSVVVKGTAGAAPAGACAGSGGGGGGEQQVQMVMDSEKLEQFLNEEARKEFEAEFSSCSEEPRQSQQEKESVQTNKLKKRRKSVGRGGHNLDSHEKPAMCFLQ